MQTTDRRSLLKQGALLGAGIAAGGFDDRPAELRRALYVSSFGAS